MTRRRLFRAPSPESAAGLDVGALAPMVDMMTLLLVFLLRSYSTEAAPTPPSGAFALATTTSEEGRRPAVEILVTPEAIWVEGRRAVAVPYLGDAALVREIYDPLLLMRGKSRVEVHADAAVPYAVLKRVFYTARAAGFDELVLVGASRQSL